MEKILRLLWFFITSMLLFYSHSLNVEGRHHISKKPKSKNVISYPPPPPSPVDGSVNEPSPLSPPPPASSPSNVVPSDPSYGGSPDLDPNDCVF